MNRKWYKESYFNKNNWILENANKLGLSCEESMLVLLINLAANAQKKISYEFLAEKMGKTTREIDKLIADLSARNYLKLSSNKSGVKFDIDPLFEFDMERYELSENRELYDIVSEVFGKPLSQSQLQKMNDLIAEFSKDNFIQALRIAEAQRKFDMAYIEGILRNEKKRADNSKS